ncbi:DUF983 domain-containing protein [Sphingomonas sp. BIUV-7]|uniref:DUF983 domain-containing protein n=1 Tax=Sphingomonas natans TaxID=3063330 RepID=A0ABT8YBE7_9SPHN|nr:DUF983 domain-containing protein [Sphingomonas sp. BIUV-7]MDO6415657.1 DUF983 domain-containing protein [Sphingomonas sp. BIUV-7]
MTAPTPLDAGLRGLCPRCGAKTLFTGWIKFVDRCSACGLDIAAFNVGDGPAAFLTLVIGAIVAAAAIALELSVSPSWWVHVLIWPPVTLALIIGSLRTAKGALIALEYRNAAREGRISEK